MLRTARVAMPAFLAAAVLALGAAFAGAQAAEPRYEKVGSLHRVEWGTVAYGFDAAWRAETLWTRTDAGWVRVASPDPEKLAAFRRMLLHRTGATSLGHIASEGQAALASLRSLGYI